MELTTLNSHNSILSIVAVSDSIRDRRSAITSSWSAEEAAERQRLAVKMQVGLATLILLGQRKRPRLKRVLELAS